MTRDRGRKLRIGLTDPKGPFATQVREVFHESPVPVARFVSLGSSREDGVLSEIDGEAEFLQPPSRETIADLDLLILGGSPADSECRALASEGGVAAFDIADSPPAAEGCSAVLAALDPIPAEAAFTILLPASEAGAGGVEELFAQTGASLNFRPAETSVFESRLAFNVFRDAAVVSLEAAVRASLERRFPSCRISMLAARIPLFHGYAGSSRLRFRSEAEAKTAIRQLGASRELSVGGKAGEASAAAAVEDARVLLDPPARTAETVSFWFAFDGLALAARSALGAASRLLG